MLAESFSGVSERRLPAIAVTPIASSLVRVLLAITAEERAGVVDIFHAALALVLRRFTGNDELVVRTGGATDCDIRTLMDDSVTFRSAVRIVRDAHLNSATNITRWDDHFKLVVVGAPELEFVVIAGKEGYALTLTTLDDTLALQTIASIQRAIDVLLHAVADAPDTAATHVPLTSVDECRRLLRRGDGPRNDAFGTVPLDRIVAERAALTPDALAVIDGERSTTYRQLVARAATICSALQVQGVRSGQRVGVCSNASADLFATMLGIWSVGAVYVPLDPAVPRERLATIARDAGIVIAIVDRIHAETIRACRTMPLDEIEESADISIASVSETSAAAYVLYTSGSTGVPKGVEIGHAAASNAIRSAIDICAFTASDRTLYRTAISFDLSVYDIFCALVSGATLIIAPKPAAGDPQALIDMVMSHGVTHLLLGPALLAALLERADFGRCTTLRIVTCGGEALPVSLVKRFLLRSAAVLYNLYGPSEATMLVTLHRCTIDDVNGREASAPLGGALANTHVSVRDGAQWPVPRGAIGEVTIGGIQLASRYLRLPDETKRRFVSDPARAGERLYRTGDLARLLDDGSIVFLSRNDNQVKIRGNRVEPGEVAAAIERLPDVQAAVVCAQHRSVTDLHDALVLVAYVLAQANATLSIAAIRDGLRAALPPSMVPNEIVCVQSFPLTVSGKIDTKALVAGAYRAAVPLPEQAAPAAEKRESSLRGIVREEVRMIWESLLKHSEIGDYDNFFDIGGDSLLAVRMMHRVEESFGHRVALADFLDSMTIAALATLIASGTSSEERDAIIFNESGTRVPLVYLHGDFAGGSYAWSLARMLGEDQPLTVVPPDGIFGRVPATNVRTMAQRVVATIERLHPAGPLRIGGYSAAGLVAYEAACRLTAAGRDVRDVVLVGTDAEQSAFSILQRLADHSPLPERITDLALRFALWIGMRLKRWMRMSFSERLRRIGRLIGVVPAAIVSTPNELELGKEYARYVRAHAAYVPGRYDGALTVLWPEGETLSFAELGRDWRSVAPSVIIEAVPGSHHSCVSRHLDRIAEAIRRG